MRGECRERFPRHRLQRKSLVGDAGMHHGKCVMHVGIINLWRRRKPFQHSRHMHNPQFCISGKRFLVDAFPSLLLCIFIHRLIIFLLHKSANLWQVLSRHSSGSELVSNYLAVLIGSSKRHTVYTIWLTVMKCAWKCWLERGGHFMQVSMRLNRTTLQCAYKNSVHIHCYVSE